jgi:hypothetical protein
MCWHRWGRTVMIANANPCERDYDETLHALKYAAIAREVRLLPRVETKHTRSTHDIKGRLIKKGGPKAAAESDTKDVAEDEDNENEDNDNDDELKEATIDAQVDELDEESLYKYVIHLTCYWMDE